MRNSLSVWLATIIVLAIIAFLAVFKPITFTPRKDPSDPSQYLRPLFTEKFDPLSAPKAFITQGNMNIYFYTPQHDLRLDLDLRGGMRVVLEIPNRGQYDYQLVKPLAGAEEAGTKQNELRDVLAAADMLGDIARDPSKVQVVVSEGQAQIVTQPASRADAEADLTKINRGITKVFGAENFKEPNAENVYKEVTETEQDTVRQIMEKRLNGTGLSEVRTMKEGTNRVVLEIPGVKDPDRVRKMLHTTAVLEFRLVPADITVDTDKSTGITTATRQSTHSAILEPEAINSSYLVITGGDLDADACKVGIDDKGKPAVDFSMKTSDAKNKFGHTTAGNIGRQLAIVLDGHIVTAPVIRGEITDHGQISGGFNTTQEAQDLVVMLKAGALPVPVHIVQNRTVSATLGADSVSMSLQAGVVGLLLVLIFMAAYYRLPGLMANMALIIYIILSLAVLKFFDVTLSLPGIAGIIISIGMAVDANVIIFERLKEELRTKKPLETAIDVAFSRAWTAILDSNVASLITGGVLTWLGTGAVRGFAITLMIGVAVSLFTAVTVTRLFMRLMIRSRAGHNLSWYGI